MARIRTVKPEFWRDEELSTISAEAALLAIGLLNYADDEGYFNANPKLVASDVFPLRDLTSSVSSLLQELTEIGYIRLFSGTDGKKYGLVVNFTKHQAIQKTNPSKIKQFCIDTATVRESQQTIPVVLPNNFGSAIEDKTEVKIEEERTLQEDYNTTTVQVQEDYSSSTVGVQNQFSIATVALQHGKERKGKEMEREKEEDNKTVAVPATDSGGELEPLLPMETKPEKPKISKPKSEPQLPIPEKLASIEGFESTWNQWREFRKKIRHPMTPHGEALLFKKLEEFHEQGLSPIESIENSIACGYQGLFPPKPKFVKNGSTQPNQKPTPRGISDFSSVERAEQDVLARHAGAKSVLFVGKEAHIQLADGRVIQEPCAV